MNELRIADDFSLPRKMVTETLVVLAKRGSGKTYTVKVLAEEMIASHLLAPVIDPLGVWWGLRLGADGKSAGLPVIIFGGVHQDLPLEVTSGRILADMLIDMRFPAVFDLSHLFPKEQIEWMTDFTEQVYHRNREPLHLILDEADLWAPQNPAKGSQRLLEAMEAIVRRGRVRGLGATLITQRAASLNKNVLTQAEVLLALRMNYKSDVDALDAWIKQQGDADLAGEMRASLPSLPTGTAWVWSPLLDILQKIKVRPARTFDSSATPTPDDEFVPRVLAPVDIAELSARLSVQIERAHEQDPAHLQRRIKELEQQLAKNSGATIPPARIETKEVVKLVENVSPQELEALHERISIIKQNSDGTTKRCEEALTFIERMQGRIAHTNGASSPRVSAEEGVSTAHAPSEPTSSEPTSPAPQSKDIITEEKPSSPKRSNPRPSPPHLSSAQHRLLGVLLGLKNKGVTFIARANALILAGLTPDDERPLKDLLHRGFVEYNEKGWVTITDVGASSASEFAEELSLQQLHKRWNQFLPAHQATMLRVLLKSHPRPVQTGDLKNATGLQGGSYSRGLEGLDERGLCSRPSFGKVVASSWLFPPNLH